MRKFAYILPGYQENKKTRKAYELIARYFKEKGIKPVHVPIKWNMKSPGDFNKYNQQFLKKFKKVDEVYVLGFSYGAVIALMTAQVVKPKALILCSLSPYFIEDYKNIKPLWLKWWKEHFINEISFVEVVQGVTAKTYFLVGDREHRSVLKRARAAKRKVMNSKLVMAKGAAHNIGNKKYLEVIKKIIGSL